MDDQSSKGLNDECKDYEIQRYNLADSATLDAYEGLGHKHTGECPLYEPPMTNLENSAFGTGICGFIFAIIGVMYSRMNYPKEVLTRFVANNTDKNHGVVFMSKINLVAQFVWSVGVLLLLIFINSYRMTNNLQLAGICIVALASLIWIISVMAVFFFKVEGEIRYTGAVIEVTLLMVSSILFFILFFDPSKGRDRNMPPSTLSDKPCWASRDKSGVPLGVMTAPGLLSSAKEVSCRCKQCKEGIQTDTLPCKAENSFTVCRTL